MEGRWVVVVMGMEMGMGERDDRWWWSDRGGTAVGGGGISSGLSWSSGGRRR